MKKEKWTNEELTDKLFRHDETALACLYEAFADDLLNYFSAQYKMLSKEEVGDILTDALIKLVENPEKFKPKLSSIKTYLITDIKGDIINALAKQKRTKKKLSIVELSANHGNIKEESQPETSLLKSQVMQFFQHVFDNSKDVELAWMMEVDKERTTEEYSRILEISDLPFAEQRAEVKKHKDRIQKKLNRSGWKDFLQKLKQNA